MANHHLKNKNLPMKSKGLLSQMLSLPEDWDYTLKALSMINRKSIDAIREAVRELEQVGYIVRTRERNEFGHLKGTDYTIFEKPQPAADSPEIWEPISENPALEKPMLENPILENPVLEKPTLENPTQLNTKKTNKDPLMTKGLSKHPSISDPSREAAEKKDEMELDAQSIKDAIQNKIEYEFIVQRFDKDRLDEIVDLMLATIQSVQS